jgi:CRP/FNR family transcriptional regulator
MSGWLDVRICGEDVVVSQVDARFQGVRITESAPEARRGGPQIACSNCSLHELCLSGGLDEIDLEAIDQIVSQRRRIPKGGALFGVGDVFRSIYAVRFGLFKTEGLTPDGREQVTGFQMAGELLGLDGISTDRHACKAVALEDSEVCVIPFTEMESLGRTVPALQHNLHRVMSRELVQDRHLLVLLGSARAEERLAAFLLNLSDRHAGRGYSSSEFILRMTRDEIGSYLGLTPETVSRTFTKLQKSGLIEVAQKHIRIPDLPALRSFIGC